MIIMQDSLWKTLDYWLDSEFFAVGIFSFAGVAVRVGITNEFRAEHALVSDMSNYGPFLQLFYSQSYLLANVIGCFIIGICLKEFKTINGCSTGLFKGLTTGLCGSITTFSSWINFTNNHTFDDLTWSYILEMIIIEYCVTWAAFSLGMICIDLKNELFEHLHHQKPPALQTNPHALSAEKPINDSKREEFTYEHIQSLPDEPTQQMKDQEVLPIRNTNNENIEEDLEEEVSPSMQQFTTQPATTEPISTLAQFAQFSEDEKQQQSIAAAAGKKKWWSERRRILLENDCRLLWCLLFLLISIPIWFTLLFQSSQSFYTTNGYYRDTLRSIALGPLGAWLRWSFTRSVTLKTTLPEMHLYTFTANMLATTLQCALLLWAVNDSTWIVPINQGFNGSLSTVSTLLVEIWKLYTEKGAVASCRYALVTFLGAMGIVQILRAAAGGS